MIKKDYFFVLKCDGCKKIKINKETGFELVFITRKKAQKYLQDKYHIGWSYDFPTNKFYCDECREQGK